MFRVAARSLLQTTRPIFRVSSRNFGATTVRWKAISQEDAEILHSPRESDDVDVCIVGGGPAGLATAIKLKQLDHEQGDGELRVVVLEKAADFGSHILSGAVLEPRALKELFPDLDHEGIPLPDELVTKVTRDLMKYLTQEYAFPLPEPPQMKNTGKNYIVSLNEVVKYLAEQAEELGVELYPSISVSELIYDDSDAVKGVATRDMGINKAGLPKDLFERGMEFHAKFTVLAEGCHGLLTKQVMSKYALRDNVDPQTYGIGLKEVWEVLPENFEKGFVGHSMGYPLSGEYGGGFMYHWGDNMVSVGLVVGLDYANPYLSPYQEFQKMKKHPFYANVLEGGTCISYGARALNEGGLQSVPKLSFPGGVLVGCGAGFMNVPKIKGSHTAMKSGMLAAENIYESLDREGPVTLNTYDAAYKNLWIYDELHEVRNVRPSFANGIIPGLIQSGLSTFITKGSEPYTLHHHTTDAAATQPAANFKPIDYPKADGELTFDILTSVSRTGTYHDDDEPCHLRIPNMDYDKHSEISYPKYKGIEQRFCPAGVYEYVEDELKPDGVSFKINSQNCIHCKTCDIKVPTQDINWTVPEGGDGPKYVMT